MTHTSGPRSSRGGARRPPSVSNCAAATAAERPQAHHRPIEEAKVWTAIGRLRHPDGARTRSGEWTSQGGKVLRSQGPFLLKTDSLPRERFAGLWPGVAILCSAAIADSGPPH
jgi:hypothetical protein